ncbi:DUF397 domain-containing protein [Actinomadura sp. 1N219]|uniref:DUF397 domain-containing protein n=1 Tax=Actinomadura sp. 1N219 TaxID=3375152 RepID=UPI003794255D
MPRSDPEREGLQPEPTPIWRKARRSMASNECVELARLGEDRLGIRDSQAGPDAPVLSLNLAKARTLMRCVRRVHGESGADQL